MSPLRSRRLDLLHGGLGCLDAANAIDDDGCPLVSQFSRDCAADAKLIDLASSHDYLTPPAMHFEPYRRLVERAGASARYRGAIIDGAQHVDALAETRRAASRRR